MFSALKQFNRKRVTFFRKVRNKILLTYYYLRYERKRARNPLKELPQCTNIGLLVLGGIGDAIVMSGLIRALQDHGKQVYCICTSKLAPLFESLIHTDRVFVIPQKGSISEIATQNIDCDVLIDFSDPDKNLYQRIRYLSAIKHRFAIGFNQDDKHFYDLNLIRDEKGCHWTERFKATAYVLGVNIAYYRYFLSFSKECEKEVESFCNKLSSKFVLFNPTASDKYRTLSAEVVNKTLNYLENHTALKIVVFNFNDDKVIAKHPKIVFMPFKELDRCMCLVGHCQLIISTDTSFVHAANFFRVPLIAIYNNRLASGRYDNNVQWGPNYPQAVQIFSTENSGTETGDDLRKLPFSILEKALNDSEILRNN